MKSAEEWIKVLGSEVDYSCITAKEIKEIQLDSWKQGMTDAARIIDDSTTKNPTRLIDKILLLRNIKTTETL